MQDVPLIVTEEAAAHVARLGMQHVLEQNFEWIRLNVPDLFGIHVELWYDGEDEGEQPLVFINAHQSSQPGPHCHLLLLDWADWIIRVLPKEALGVFVLSPAYHSLPSKAA